MIDALPKPSGFTLIELLVVVAILSAAALLAFGVVADDRMQIRYDDTRNRMQSVYRAVLGRLEPFGGNAMGGFVADNGELPASLSALLSAGSLLAQGGQQPLFDPQPNTATCANNGGESSVVLPVLLKGHRGSYLGGLAFNGELRDGWGNIEANAALDALNFGWTWDASVANTLALTSLGADNAAGGTNFATDSTMVFAPGDWRVPLSGLSVKLRNLTGVDIPADSYSVSLLVFRNNGTGSAYWHRYSSDANAAVVAVGDSAALTFGGRCAPGGTGALYDAIPQGRHLLVLVKKGVGGWNNDETPHPAANPVFAHFDLVAGQTPAQMELNVR